MNKLRNRSIWSIDEILLGTDNISPSGPGSNGNEGVLHTSQSLRTEASTSIQGHFFFDEESESHFSSGNSDSVI